MMYPQVLVLRLSVREELMGRTCNVCGSDETCIQHFNGKTREEWSTWKTL